MDISDLVHGMKKKKRKGESSGSSHDVHASEHEESTNRQQSSQRGQAAQAGSSSSHGHSHRRDKSGTSPDSSSPSPPRASSSRDRGSSSKARLQCELCQRTFDTKTKFDQHCQVFHRRSKVPSKPREAAFVCPECNKAFTSPSKRNVHQNATHMGLRPYQCDVCPKSFGYKGDLTKHMATHSGSKPHSCYICGARFARNFYVKRHIENVHEKKGTPKKE